MMKRHLLWVCGLFLWVATTAADDPLKIGFQHPPASAKARTWWHWINGNVTKHGITADLEAMKRVGIQEAQLFNVDQGYPQGPATYLGEEWLELFRFATAEAKRLGLEIGFHNGAGWSSSGGPWVTPEHAMQTVVFNETTYEGGRLLREKLPQPATKLSHYKEIAVIAFPTPEEQTRLNDRELKTLSGGAFPNHLLPDSRKIDGKAIVPKAKVIDLTSRMRADGTLYWKAPAGKWTVLRIGHTPTGTENRPANEQIGRGLECDKMSRAAVDAYWAGGIEPILKKVGALVGKHLTNCLIDSYEVGCGNWTPSFGREFVSRRAYDYTPYLPILAGYYVESGEITERFLWDFRKTVGELMADNYYGRFRELCHQRGMKFSVEPYGGPYDCMQVGATGDIPMSEFWVGGKAYREASKLAASVAHLNGIAEVGAEAFTANNEHSRFLNQPATLKPLGDWAWAEGVNRFIFHTYAHQPWDVAPGMTFHMYGTEISRLNTWWEQGRAYMDYLARSQYLLQQGRFVADVLVFTGESSPNDGIHRPDIKAAGYDFDEIGADKIGSLRVKEGLICTPVGGAYRVLILPPGAWMTPELLTKLNGLAKAGATIIGPKPLRSPSLKGYPQCDVKTRQLADALWGNQPPTSDQTALIRDIPVSDVLTQQAISPDFSGGKAGADLLFIHRLAGNVDIYFVSNQQPQERTETCRFRVVGKQPERWNPETGSTETLAAWQQDKDGTTLSLHFDPQESYFILFRPMNAKKADPIVRVEAKTSPRPQRPLPGLSILKADYGHFLPDGVADVQAVLASRIKENHLQTSADNGLAGDPAPGAVKELFVEYTVGEETHRLRVAESQPFSLPAKGETGELKIAKALYGKLAPDFDGSLPPKPVDVSSVVRSHVASGRLVFTVDDQLLGKSTFEAGGEKHLRIVYSVEGERFEQTVSEGQQLGLALYTPKPELLTEEGKTVWKTPLPGSIACTTASGVVRRAEVKSIPKALDISTAWNVSFPPRQGAPAKATFDHLISWTESTDESIRYFSGTATYRRSFILTQEYIGQGRSLELELGRVRAIAEVIVNGRNLGILWKAPFRINLGDAVRAGDNELEIRVTNLWPNRLIGDARYPEDCSWGDWLPKQWPEWLTQPEKRSSKRTTFTTWRHWKADDALLHSGLFGPVMLHPYAHAPLSEEALR